MARSSFEEIPQRIFLDSSILQTLQKYGGFLYENVPVPASDPIYRDRYGISKLEALRSIMQLTERAPFEFALSSNSFREVRAKGDPRYLQWAYDVLDHWLACLAESGKPAGTAAKASLLLSSAYDYLGDGDRKLIKDAVALGCDTFLTMESKLPRIGAHVEDTLGLRIVSPIGMWEYVEPWAALYR